MKTLKKSLCLVLALVMVLGLCMVSASAKLDYEDAKEITYAEEVDVLSGIGVLEGYTDGTFLPKQEVTREEAAKIIAYLMIGNAKQADALTTTSDPFSDVSKNRWSAGYIAYLAQKGVLDGMGDGSFAPTEKVTGLQFAKMLLTAVGYGANDEYTGSNWAINVSKDALQYGIFDGNLAGANNVPATREECALYAFNTLFLNKVTYSALLGGYIENSAMWANNAESNKKDSFANDFKLSQATLDDDAFMRPEGYVWLQGKKVITEAYGVNDALVASYTTPVDGNTIYTALGKSAANRANFNVYVDGVEPEEDIQPEIAKANTNNVSYTGYGVRTYVYDFGDETRIVMINTYLGVVTGVTKESKTADANSTITFAVAKTVDGEEVTYDIFEDEDYPDDSFAEDELVLVNYSYLTKAIEEVEPAELNKGIIRKYVNKGTPKVTVEDASYYATEKAFVTPLGLEAAKDAEDILNTEVNGQEYTVILDSFGYFFGITGKAAAPNKFVFVKEFGYKFDTSDKLRDELYLTAEVLTPDGETKVLYVTYGKKSSDEVKEIVDTFDDMNSGEKDYVDGLSDLQSDDNATGLYEATYTDTTVTLINKAEEINDGEGYSVYKNVTRLAPGEYVTKATTLYYVSYEDDEDGNHVAYADVKVYNGINTVPVTKKGEAMAVAGIYTEDADDNKIYKAVAVDDLREPVFSSTIYYYEGTVRDFSKVDNKDGTYTVNFNVINIKTGEKETISYTFKKAATADDSIELADIGFVTEGMKEKVNTLVDASAKVKTLGEGEVANVEITKAGVHQIITMYLDEDEAGDGYAIDDDTKIFGKATSASGLAKLAEKYDHVEVVFVYNPDTFYASFIYVLDAYNDKVDPEPEADTVVYFLQVSRLDRETQTITTETYKLGTQTKADEETKSYSALTDLLEAEDVVLVDGAKAVIATYGNEEAYIPEVIVEDGSTTFQIYIED